MESIALGVATKVTTGSSVSIGVPLFGKSEYNMHTIYGALCNAQAKIAKLEAAMALVQEQLEKVWYAPGMPGMAEAQKDFEVRIGKDHSDSSDLEDK